MDVIIDSSSGFDKNTTNNRMELTAVIKSLQSDYIKSNSVVTIKSDSQLIINTMNMNWKKAIIVLLLSQMTINALATMLRPLTFNN